MCLGVAWCFLGSSCGFLGSLLGHSGVLLLSFSTFLVAPGLPFGSPGDSVRCPWVHPHLLVAPGRPWVHLGLPWRAPSGASGPPLGFPGGPLVDPGFRWVALGPPFGATGFYEFSIFCFCIFLDFSCFLRGRLCGSQVVRLRPVGVPPGSHMSIHTYRHIPCWFVATSQSCFHSVGCIGSPRSMDM